MSNELIIGIGGLVLSVLTYFAGVWRAEKRHDAIDKATRMNAVFDRYMEFRKSNHTAGMDGLLKAGIATLESDAEIRELSNRIAAHGERHPLGDPDEQFENVNLKLLFEYAAKNRVNFLSISIEEVIDYSRA